MQDRGINQTVGFSQSIDVNYRYEKIIKEKRAHTMRIKNISIFILIAIGVFLAIGQAAGEI